MPFLNIVKQVLRGNEIVEHNLGTNIPKEKYCSYSGSHLSVVFWSWGGGGGIFSVTTLNE